MHPPHVSSSTQEVQSWLNLKAVGLNQVKIKVFQCFKDYYHSKNPRENSDGK